MNSACGNDECEYAVSLPFSICNSSASINVTVSAANRLGEGPPSDPVVTGMDAWVTLIPAELLWLHDNDILNRTKSEGWVYNSGHWSYATKAEALERIGLGLYTVEPHLSNTPQRGHLHYIRHFWMSGPYLHRVQCIQNPSTSDTLLLCIADTNVGPFEPAQ